MRVTHKQKAAAPIIGVLLVLALTVGVFTATQTEALDQVDVSQDKDDISTFKEVRVDSSGNVVITEDLSGEKVVVEHPDGKKTLSETGDAFISGDDVSKEDINVVGVSEDSKMLISGSDDKVGDTKDDEPSAPVVSETCGIEKNGLYDNGELVTDEDWDDGDFSGGVDVESGTKVSMYVGESADFNSKTSFGSVSDCMSLTAEEIEMDGKVKLSDTPTMSMKVDEDVDVNKKLDIIQVDNIDINIGGDLDISGKTKIMNDNGKGTADSTYKFAVAGDLDVSEKMKFQNANTIGLSVGGDVDMDKQLRFQNVDTLHLSVDGDLSDDKNIRTKNIGELIVYGDGDYEDIPYDEKKSADKYPY